MKTNDSVLYCVVPFYNEERWLPRLIDALNRQSYTDISYIFVDNASTDRSVEVIKKHAVGLRYKIVAENQKGTGAASATGFSKAIADGATHIARLDGDCAPQPDWVERLAGHARSDVRLVLGQVQCSREDPQYCPYDSVMFGVVRFTGTAYGRLVWRGPEYKAPFYYGIGNNFMVTSDAYQAVGGFERTAIDDADEDGVLFDKLRRFTAKVTFDRLLRSNPSLRRIRKYGYVKTMLHYWGRKYRAPEIDIR